MSAEIPALLLIPGVAPEQIRIVLLLILIVMANRAKRKAVLKEKLEREQFYQDLFKDHKRTKSYLAEEREEERQKDRWIRRWMGRGVPYWMLSDWDGEKLIRLLDQLSPYWIRKIQDFPFARQHFRHLKWSLIRHLFVRYEVPRRFYKPWDGQKDRYGFYKELDRDDHLQIRWFIHIAQGKNLRTASGLPFKLTKKMAHIAIHAPSDLNIFESLRYGQVIGLGGSEDLARTLIALHLPMDPYNQDFYTELIKWFIRYEPFELGCVRLMTRYLLHKSTPRVLNPVRGVGSEWVVPQHNRFTMKGRSMRKIWTEAMAWRYAETWENQSFAHNPICNQVGDLVLTKGINGENFVYTIRPILTRLELWEEGEKMNHCVGDSFYAGKSTDGRLTVWSLKLWRKNHLPKHLLTITLNRDMKLVEIAGKNNRYATASELSVIWKWVKAQKISISYRTLKRFSDSRKRID